MEQFFALSPQHRILLGLAVLTGLRTPKEITEWLNVAVEYYGAQMKMSEDDINKNRRVEGTVKNMMKDMSETRVLKQRGFVLEKKRRVRKYFYRAGQYTVNQRVSALFLRLLERVSNAQHETLSIEQAIKITELDRALVFSLTEQDSTVRKDVEWLLDEIAKEGVDSALLNKKFEYIKRADYFRDDHEAEGHIVPTERLSLHERDYIDALIYLLPELKGV